MSNENDVLSKWKKGVKNPPSDYSEILPVTIELHGYSDCCVAQHVSIYPSKATEVDLSHYIPGCDYTIKVCAKEDSKVEDASVQNA